MSVYTDKPRRDTAPGKFRRIMAEASPDEWVACAECEGEGRLAVGHHLRGCHGGACPCPIEWEDCYVCDGAGVVFPGRRK